MNFRFNTVFGAMIAFCTLTALLIPSSVSDRVGEPLSYLVVPVSSPVRGLLSSIRERISPSRVSRDDNTPKTDEKLATENAELRLEVAHLREQLQKLNAIRAAFGAVWDHSVSARVVGALPEPRQVLQISGPSGVALSEGMPVVSTRGLVGKIISSIRGVARVQLITDANSVIQCRFVRYYNDPQGRLQSSPLPGDAIPILQGTGGPGGGGLKITNLTQKQVDTSGLRPGDWLFVSDDKWPTIVQGFTLAKVREINKARSSPFMVEILADPPTDLRNLREVLVVNR